MLESIKLKINKFIRIKFSKIRRKKIKNSNFTIISNNCWGGMIYESYGLRKESPTIGLYIMPEDYIKFLKKMDYYLTKDISFITQEESKYRNLFKNKIAYPIGKIDDIEIFFVHYKNESEVIEKWERRKNRINYDNMIVKFNDQNGCTENEFKQFLELPYKNKLFFTTKNWNANKSDYIRIKQLFNRKYIETSNEPYGANIAFNVNSYINSINKQ